MGTLRKYSRDVRRDPEYVIWKGLRARISNPKHASYYMYGARGLEVDPAFDNYEVFLEEAGRRPTPKHWIERKDNSKGYVLGNLTWALPKDQCRNTRRNKVVTLDGVAKTLVEWCETLGLPYSSIRSRLRQGWDDATALLTPIRQGNYRRKDACSS